MQHNNTGIDLVKWQIRIAAGIPLSFSREDIIPRGAAAEVRINAEGTGRIKAVHIPGGPSVRFDTFIEPGTAITPYYDSLLGKLIACSATREELVRKLRASLCELVIYGVDTNIGKQIGIISGKAFEDGRYDTSLLER